jgi:hypothetical protein
VEYFQKHDSVLEHEGIEPSACDLAKSAAVTRHAPKTDSLLGPVMLCQELVTGPSFLLRLSFGVTQARFRIFILTYPDTGLCVVKQNPLSLENPVGPGIGPRGSERLSG